jgi:methyl-accepting chemotaxis protein
MNAIQNCLRGYTIRARMIAAIVMVLTLLGGVGGVGLFGMQQARQHTDQFMANSFVETGHLVRMACAMGDLRRYEKDLIINYEKPEQQAGYAKSWRDAYQRFNASANKLLEGEEDVDNPHVRELLKDVEAYHAKVESLMPQITSGAYDNAMAVNRLLGPAKDHVHAAEIKLAKLEEVLHGEAMIDQAAVQHAGTLAMWLFAASLVVAVMLVVPLTLINSRSIVEPLDQARKLAHAIAGGDLTSQVQTQGNDECTELLHAVGAMQDALRSMVGNIRQTTESISTASTQIASGNQDLSGRTEQTAGSLQQTASSMEQLTGTVRQTADSARTANQLASSAAQAAQRGGAVVAQVVQNMDQISSQSRKIAEIIGTIDGIAFQTNILALNAAVEAARAGEQGRGFAVVAGEVRNLAQRSANAAREIKSLIGASVDSVESGSRLVQDAGTTMSEIVSSVQRVSDIIGEITAAASEQSSELGQVNTAITQLEQMTQQNAALVEESAAAAESLREQAGRLSELVAAFRTVDMPGQQRGATRQFGAQVQVTTHGQAITQAQAITQSVLHRVRTGSAAGASRRAGAARTVAMAAGRPAPPSAVVAAKPPDSHDDGDWTSF